jgi:AraC-like DNA-binding protein/Rieske Fe-S protein
MLFSVYPCRGEKIMKAEKHDPKRAKFWNVSDIKGLECFRADNLIHHFRRHSHEGYTIGVIEDGFGDNNYQGSVFHLAPGKIVVMNPDETHTGCVVGKRPWSYRMFYIHEETFRDLFPGKPTSPCFRGLCFEDEYWYKKLWTLHRLLETKTDTLRSQTEFSDTFIAFSNIYGNASRPAHSGKEPKAVSMIKDYINAHFNENVSIDDLTGITQLSRAYLIRSFQRCVGIPPYAYLIQTRIKHAKRLLARKIPITQVAYEIGFADQSHLTHQFKSIMGITPKQYTLGFA